MTEEHRKIFDRIWNEFQDATDEIQMMCGQDDLKELGRISGEMTELIKKLVTELY